MICLHVISGKTESHATGEPPCPSSIYSFNFLLLWKSLGLSIEFERITWEVLWDKPC